MRSPGWALIQQDWCPSKRLGHRRAQRKDPVRTQGGDGHHAPRREAAGGTALPTPGPWTPAPRAGTEHTSVVQAEDHGTLSWKLAHLP